MKNNLMITGDSTKGASYEEEKAFFDFYCNIKPGSEFEFKNLIVSAGHSSNVQILKRPTIKAPDENCSFFLFRSEPFTHAVIIKNPCNIPKIILPFDDEEETMVMAINTIRKYKNNK